MKDEDRWFDFMCLAGKGLSVVGSTWIQRAVEQKHPKLTIDLAWSIPLIYSDLDKVLLHQEKLN